MVLLPTVKKTLMIRLAVSTEYQRVTDGRTDSPRYAYASRGKKINNVVAVHTHDRSRVARRRIGGLAFVTDHVAKILLKMQHILLIMNSPRGLTSRYLHFRKLSSS